MYKFFVNSHANVSWFYIFNINHQSPLTFFFFTVLCLNVIDKSTVFV